MSGPYEPAQTPAPNYVPLTRRSDEERFVFMAAELATITAKYKRLLAAAKEAKAFCCIAKDILWCEEFREIISILCRAIREAEEAKDA